MTNMSGERAHKITRFTSFKSPCQRCLCCFFARTDRSRQPIEAVLREARPSEGQRGAVSRGSTRRGLTRRLGYRQALGARRRGPRRARGPRSRGPRGSGHGPSTKAPAAWRWKRVSTFTPIDRGAALGFEGRPLLVPRVRVFRPVPP